MTNLRQYYALSYNFNKGITKFKKDLGFFTSKNSMGMSNSFAKKNENVERKNKNESGMHDESQKCENFIGSLYNIYKKPF